MRTAHFDQFLAAIREISGLADVVHDSEAPLQNNGSVTLGSYVIVYDLDPDNVDDDRLTLRQLPDADADYRYITRAVGVTPHAVREIDDALTANLIGRRLQVTGRRCDPIRKVPRKEPVQRDRTISEPLFFKDSDWILHSRRTGAP